MNPTQAQHRASPNPSPAERGRFEAWVLRACGPLVDPEETFEAARKGAGR